MLPSAQEGVDLMNEKRITEISYMYGYYLSLAYYGKYFLLDT